MIVRNLATCMRKGASPILGCSERTGLDTKNPAGIRQFKVGSVWRFSLDFVQGDWRSGK